LYVVLQLAKTGSQAVAICAEDIRLSSEIQRRGA
jgi:hypothetical protein